MDRRSRALVALMLFVVLTGASIVVSGSRPHLDQGAAPWVLQVIGYLCALAGGVLLMRGGAQCDADDRRLGLVVVVAVGALALIDAVTVATDSGGADIGAGFLRLICLVAVFVATARVAIATARARRTPG
jgi:peptidoglycan/LPS O-acetylase OafA/YrhL